MIHPPEHPDPLEAELQSLRPAEPSAGWYTRVGHELSAPGRLRRPAAWLPWGAAAAACVVAGVILWRSSGPPRLPVPVVTTVPAGRAVQPDDADRPALSVYRQALTGSPSELDDLLDRHAARVFSAGASPAPRVTASSDLGILR